MLVKKTIFSLPFGADNPLLDSVLNTACILVIKHVYVCWNTGRWLHSGLLDESMISNISIGRQLVCVHSNSWERNVSCVQIEVRYLISRSVHSILSSRWRSSLFSSISHPRKRPSGVIRCTFLEDIWGGAWRNLLRSSSLSQEGGVVQYALRGT
jgi:hypothetical protein